MLISEIYHKNPITIDQNDSIESALRQLINTDHNGMVVVDQATQKVLGVLSLQDIAAFIIPKEFRENLGMAAAMYKQGFFHEMCLQMKTKKVKEVMRTNYVQVGLNSNIMAVVADFLKNDLYIVPVIDSGNLVGIVTRSEIKTALCRGMGIIGSEDE